MHFPRSSGILLHPTSFPSRFGIGDLGGEAYKFIDFLAQSNQQFWQILPLGPTGYGNSPYSCYSAMAGNPLLLSPEKLQDEGLLTDEDFANLPDFSLDKVDYERVIQTKRALLRKACDRFKANISPERQAEFTKFCVAKASWLDDYALFMALHRSFGDTSWYEWEPEIAHFQPEAVQEWREKLSDEIYYRKFLQFEFYRQWSALKQYANDRYIQIIGDIPIYVAHNSADVWAHRDIFTIDEETGAAALMAGVPPDYFSQTGQLWGNPVYKWDKLQENNYQWWVERFQATFEYVDIVRIDHFLGFEAYWQVEMGETTAINGQWVKGPGAEFFQAIKEELGDLPIIAEDLGLVTPAVLALRDKFEFPGMKILHFAFGGDSDNPYLPFNIDRNCVIYTGTHDNNTTVGWFNQIQDHERENAIRYLGCIGEEGIHWALIRLALSSIANLAIIPLQDILGLGEEAQMNRPGIAQGNWDWYYRSGALTDELRDRLKTLTHIYGRKPHRS
ncbi:4-alpha-glucanotransferase [Symplocastrum sp. BBK-W-15]|uniref:4-alpha-glucanotransferase n=2 Tax=Limnofasciculus TaxID=3064905 RepID=A0AAE3GMJ2_9CYAN|nr:4-alpha-glucanotransferase [Limnofasciculus baicalensis BBK-W-15]